MIIGICGLIGSGKDTIADYLIKRHNFQKLSFADKLKDRIQKLIYFDAVILNDGQKPFDITPKEIVKQRIELAKIFGNGISIPAPSADALGVFDVKKSLLLQIAIAVLQNF